MTLLIPSWVAAKAMIDRRFVPGQFGIGRAIFHSCRATSEHAIVIASNTATINHSSSPLPSSGSTPNRTSIHSRDTIVRIPSRPLEIAATDPIQNLNDNVLCIVQPFAIIIKPGKMHTGR
jgi:hypothetical protein